MSEEEDGSQHSTQIMTVAKGESEMHPHPPEGELRPQEDHLSMLKLYESEPFTPEDDVRNMKISYEDGKPELYSFEDYVPLEPISPTSPTNSIPADNHMYKQTTCRRGTICRSGKTKKLERSRTLPIIHITKPSNENESSTVTPRMPSVSKRKQSVPTITIQRSSDTPSIDDRYTNLQPGDRSGLLRSQSYDRCLVACSSQRISGSAWNFEDDTDSTASSENMTSCSDDVSMHRSPTQLYYTTPPKANMVRNQDERRRSSSHRDLLREMNRKRSVSLDCGDGRNLLLLASEPENLQDSQRSKQQIRASPSDPGGLLRMNGFMSPGRPPKIPLTTPKKRGSVSSTDTDSSSPGKYDKRKSSDKSLKLYDIIALFDAVEHQDMDLVKEILETNGLDVNSVNSECLTPLDIAVMTNNIPMAKMLLSHGARESPIFDKGEMRSARLDLLVLEAEQRVVNLTAAVLNGSSGSMNISSAQQKENERQLNHWEFRHRLLKRMKAGYDHARPPDCPTNVLLSVSSSSSLLVKFGAPLNHNGAVVTKYKVEWSCHEDFKPIVGEKIVQDVRCLEVEVRGLERGKKYFMRVAAWNMKGYGSFTTSSPSYAVPSSWRDLENSIPRSEGKMKILDDLFAQVKQLRPSDASEIRESTIGSTSPVLRKKKGFKNLFSSAPKFQKSLKRGVYLACFIYTEDRVLVTSEDQLPIVEVDENYTNPSVHTDFHWLMKVACTWDDIKSLRQDMDKSTSAGSVLFRSKLLQACAVLQNALGIQDLGQFYHKPLKDPNGSIVLVTINHIRDTKGITLGSSKWVQIPKFQRRQSAGMSWDMAESQDYLATALSEMMIYNQTSKVHVHQGLYLGYLRLHATVDLVRVLVAQKSPNILPNVKIRDLSNVSREEWEWLRSLNTDNPVPPPHHQPKEFQIALSKASEQLFKSLGLSDGFAANHRVYDMEVVELSQGVTLILVLPPVEDVCIVPGQSEESVERNDLMLLPVQVFEMINMCTYQPEFISRFSRLSSILEMDIILAQQAQREAFSKEELNTAKDRVQQLCNLQQNLDKTRKGMSWIMDLITYARDRAIKGGIPVSAVLNTAENSDLERREKVFDNSSSLSCHSSVLCDSNEISVGKDNRRIAKFYDPMEEMPKSNGHVTPDESSVTSQSSNSGILRVYAAYETGLARGTSVKLHVTTKTTAREVIDLVVSNLNQSVKNKGRDGPIYSDESLSDFCLVAVIGARERILRDDYQPLQLQNPWTKGRLYVRHKNNLLAAIQHVHATTV